MVLHHHDHDDGDDHDHHHDSDKAWYEFLVINEENLLYVLFNMLVTILCLVSGYYYGSMAGFRYSDVNANSYYNRVIILSFESIFFVHMLLQFFVNA